MSAPATPETAFDLDAYFARIGYDGPRRPTLETLHELHALHLAAIPFEAIDILMDRDIDLAPRALENKLILGSRGGYCFEQNGIFQRVLTALGFEVEGMAGRVRWLVPANAAPRPRTHMALRVAIDGQAWLADVGFGAAVFTTPLRLDRAGAQTTRYGVHRLTQTGHDLLVETQLKGRWFPVYQLSREAQLEADYELANWYCATHPESPFRQRLMVALTRPDAQHTLVHNRLTVRTPDGGKTRHTLSAHEIEQCLATTFGLPVAPEWRAVTERAVAQGQAERAGSKPG